MKHLQNTRHLVSETDFVSAKRRLLEENIDINIGLIGHANGTGDAFLTELLKVIDKNRSSELVDEMVTNILVIRHDHHLADEAWNCPSDDRFRKTSLEDAKILHYFADGHFVGGRFLGRNPNTLEGKLWFRALNEMNQQHGFDHWLTYDTVNEALPLRFARAMMR